ncbi:hypothetical protein [Mycolicibacterium fortuitum]|uniref:hypothetical protein n=1 Tax=Mycolicibacterium fortuitum TaxID=1766 RepID=UPI00260ADBEF|nr:hypothetical protein [Mycolicibacterium fortuitum]
MPAGVDVEVEDGFARIEFVDRSLRGRGLGKLLEVGTPPELIDKVTRPQLAYIVPEGNARLAGLLDEADVQDAIVGTAEIPDGAPVPDPVFAEGGPLPDGSQPVLGGSGEDVLPKSWPDGEPSDQWKRPELDAYARSKGIDPTELPNKDEVLAAIEAKEGK